MELLMPMQYEKHMLLRPFAAWPEPVNRTFRHLNPARVCADAGASELGVSGKLANWDRSADLGRIAMPTLVIGARHDTMDPAYMEMMAKKLPQGRYLFCPNAGHLAMYDDPQIYMQGLVKFLKDVDAGKKMR